MQMQMSMLMLVCMLSRWLILLTLLFAIHLFLVLMNTPALSLARVVTDYGQRAAANDMNRH